MQLVSARLLTGIVQRYVFVYKKQNPLASLVSNFSQPDAELLSTKRNAASGQLLVAPAAPAATHSFCGLTTSIRPSMTPEWICNSLLSLCSRTKRLGHCLKSYHLIFQVLINKDGHVDLISEINQKIN